MKKALIALIPGMLGLAACQVGVSYGPGAPQPSASASAEPTAAPTAAPSASPTGTPSASPTATASPMPSAQQPVPFTSLLDRDTSVTQEERTLVIDNQAAYEQFWTRHGGTQARPAVDFAQNTVVAVYRREAAYSGLGYEIITVSRANRTVTVQYRQRLQQDGRVYLPVISNTIHAVSIPLSKQRGDYDSIVVNETL